MNASPGFTDECFAQKIKETRNGFTRRLLKTESDIISYKNMGHNNFSGKVVEEQTCDFCHLV
jgi:hypothetical protein